MTLFFQAAACALVAVVLCCLLNSQERTVGVLLGLAVCVLVLLAAISYLQPVMELIQSLCSVAQISADMIQIIFKAVGIGIITELTVLICADGGNSAIGRALEILAAAAILWLAIPLMRSLLELMQTILGEL